MMNILNECSFLKPDGIAKVEEAYKAKYVFESCLKDRNGNWLNFPVAIFYTKEAHPEGSNYFALYKRPGEEGVYISNGISAVEETYTGIAVGNDVAYSRYRHDFRSIGDCFVDGGRDYLRCGGSPDSVVKFRVVEDRLELVDSTL
jgi:hypothetical protein